MMRADSVNAHESTEASNDTTTVVNPNYELPLAGFSQQTPEFNRPAEVVKARVMPEHYAFCNAAVTHPQDSEPRLCYLQ